jgi:Na+-transporting methylmalonyl-CoA/oxaloacetate decarboxylase gamma subunit
MRLFTPLPTKDESLAERTSPRFNWLETLAVPLVVGVMEAQFGVLGFVIWALLFTGKSEPPLLLEGGVIVIWWSTYWWAFVVKRGIQPRLGEERAQLVYLPALVMIYLLVVGLHPPFVASVPQLIGAGILSLSFWWRGKVRVEKEGQEESLLLVFQVGFAVLLGVLAIALAYPPPTHAFLLETLNAVVPLFCLSGFVALSFMYLSSMYSPRGGSKRNASRTRVTRTGLLVLFFLVAIVASTLLLSVVAFEPLEVMFSPWLAPVRAFFLWLLRFLWAQPDSSKLRRKPPRVPGIDRPPPKPRRPPPTPDVMEGIWRLLLVIGIVLLVLFILVVLLWILQRILQSDEDEIREGISVQPTRKKRQQQQTMRRMREALDAASARARYREFLQMMAWRGGNERKRRPCETPLEYQQRLLTYIAPDKQVHAVDTPDDTRILEELTQAYLLERYGEKQVDARRLAYLRKRVPRLTRRLIPKPGKKMPKK